MEIKHFIDYMTIKTLNKMHKPKFWEKAKKELKKRDKKLGKIIDKYPKDFLFSKSDPFYTIARSIVGQQISVKAAEAVWKRLESKIKQITPSRVSKTHFMSLKSCGLSRQKINYLKSLSDSFLKKDIDPNNWSKLPDEVIIDQLIRVRGIGRWTAEMFLIFNLCRPDVFPIDDVGLIRGICKCYNLKYPISKEYAIILSEQWKPWRSVATWYFWRSLDPIPVEY